MKSLFLFILFAFTLPLAAQNQSAYGYCENGGIKVVTQGMNSTTLVQASYPKCLVTVYLTGTTTKASIFDGAGHALANPFTATTSGFWQFLAATTSNYDVMMSGGVPAFPAPFTISDVSVGGGGGGGGTCAGCIVSSPTASQIISQPTGTNFEIDASGLILTGQGNSKAAAMTFIPTPISGIDVSAQIDTVGGGIFFFGTDAAMNKYDVVFGNNAGADEILTENPQGLAIQGARFPTHSGTVGILIGSIGANQCVQTDATATFLQTSGSPCGTGGGDVQQHPAGTQFIQEPSGKSFGVNAVNWSGDLTSVNNPTGLFAGCNMYDKPIAYPFEETTWVCNNRIINDNYPGYSLGNYQGVSSPWYIFLDDQTVSTSSASGIHGALAYAVNWSGIGDDNFDDVAAFIKPGSTASSDEGAVFHRDSIQEVGEMLGTIATGGGGQGATLLTINCSAWCNSVGVGQPLVDSTTGVSDTAVSATNVTFSGAVVEAVVMTGTYTPSVCGTIPNVVVVVPGHNNTPTNMTFTVNVPSDLTSMVGQLFVPIAAASDTERLTSVGAFSGGSQTVTVPIRSPIPPGTAFCVGGAAGSWMLQPFDVTSNSNTGTHHYLTQVYGSPSAHTLYVGESRAGTVQGFYGLSSINNNAVTIYQGALVVTALNPANNTATGSWLHIADNNAAFANGDTVIHTGRMSASWSMGRKLLTVANPYAAYRGQSFLLYSPTYSSGAFMGFTNEVDASNYVTHGGKYSPPVGLLFGDGQEGSNSSVLAGGIFFSSAPEGGNNGSIQPDLIEVGGFAAGSTRTNYNVFNLFTGGARTATLNFTPSTDTLDFFSINSGPLNMTLNESRVCTDAANCSGSVTHTLGNLTAGSLILGNGTKDIATVPGANWNVTTASFLTLPSTDIVGQFKIGASQGITSVKGTTGTALAVFNGGALTNGDITAVDSFGNLEDGHVSAADIFAIVGSFDLNASQTTSGCATSGMATFSQPFFGNSDKKVLVTMAACLGSITYTYDTPFTLTPTAFGTLASVITSTSTTAVVIDPGTATTGTFFLEGY